MDYDPDQVDEATLALLYLGTTELPGGGGRAWRGLDLQTLARLQQKGWIGPPSSKSISLDITPAGLRKMKECFQARFAPAPPDA